MACTEGRAKHHPIRRAGVNRRGCRHRLFHRGLDPILRTRRKAGDRLVRVEARLRKIALLRQTKVVVTSSAKDSRLVHDLQGRFRKLGIKAHIAYDPVGSETGGHGETFDLIEHCDVFVILWTKNTSVWSHHTLGYAIAKNKPIIALVELGIAAGGLIDKRTEKFSFDRRRREAVFTKAVECLQSMDKKTSSRRRLNALEIFLHVLSLILGVLGAIVLGPLVAIAGIVESGMSCWKLVGSKQAP